MKWKMDEPKGEKWKTFVTFTGFVWKLKLDHLVGWILSVLWNSSTLLTIPGQIHSKKSAWWTLHFKNRPLKRAIKFEPDCSFGQPVVGVYRVVMMQCYLARSQFLTFKFFVFISEFISFFLCLINLVACIVSLFVSLKLKLNRRSLECGGIRWSFFVKR